MKLLKKHFDTALECPDGIKKLRELILTLAMQGKLVEQDLSEQPASELLKDIQAEKDHLVAEGKIKKQKPLPVIRADEIPYQIPESWEWVRLGEIAEFKGGFAYKSTLFANAGDYQVLRLGNIRPDFIRLNENPVFIDEKLAIETNDYCLKEGDVIITMTGTRAKRDYIYSLRIDSNTIEGKTLYLNQRLGLMRFTIDSNYINKAIKVENLKDIIFKTATGSANQANISSVTLKNWTIPLPPLAEQKRIVERIDQLMDLCDKLESQRKNRDEKRLAVHSSAVNRLLSAVEETDFNSSWQFITRNFSELYSVKENVAELKKAILTLAMQGKLVRQDPADQPVSELIKEIQAEKERLIADDKIKKHKSLPEIKPEEIPYQIPESWEWVRLGEIGEINPRNNFDDIEDTGFVPMPRIFSQLGKQHTYEIKKWVEIKKGYTHFANDDVGVAKITPCFENRKSCVFRDLPNGIGAGTTELHIFRNSFNSIDPEFLLIYFKNPKYIELGISKMTGSAGQKRVPRTYFAENPFPLPPLAEQKRIVEKIDQLMALCDKLEEHIELSTNKQTALFDAVLSKV